MDFSTNDHATMKASRRLTPRRVGARWHVCWLAMVLPLLALLGAGCGTTDPETVAPGMNPPPGPGFANYSTNLMQEGDVVSITFGYTTNFNVVQKISLDGTLNLQAVGVVKAAGKTPDQLEADLTKLYKSQVNDDTVTVKVVSATASVYVSGAVYRPGKIPLERPMTVLEALMEAGGFELDRAKLSEVVVLRVDGGRQQRYVVNLKRVLDGDETKTFFLRPFDIVHVPQKTFNY